MTDIFNTPALRVVGAISHPHINYGQPIPLLECVEPKGQPSINTPEGWKALAERRTAG